MPKGYVGRLAGGSDRMVRIAEENRRRHAELEKPLGTSKARLLRAQGDISQVPDGGYRGAVLARDVDGNLQWTTPIGSIVPKYYITLAPDGTSYYNVNTFGSFTTQAEAKSMLPEPLIEHNQGLGSDVTQLDWPPSWGNELADWSINDPRSDPMPVQLEIYLLPLADGDKFRVFLPSTSVGSGGAPWFTVIVYNETEFDASVEIASHESLIYDGGIMRPSTYETLVSGEYFAWKVDSEYFDHVSRVQPFWQSTNIGLVDPVGLPLDNWYWKNVRALEQQQSFSSLGGDLVAGAGLSKFHNARKTSVRIGKVTAAVVTPPTGGPIEIQVLRNGVTPIFASPLTIAAGTDYAEAIPDADWSNISIWTVAPGDEPVLLFPGEYLTIEIVSVGLTDPGANLTVQVYYG